MPSAPPFLAVWLLPLAVLQGVAHSETVCGQKGPLTRIVGGQPANDGEWPWQVSILYGGKHVCGGSLIAEQWVVTAAHCVTKNIKDYEVNIGAYQLQNVNWEQQQISTMNQIIPDNKYSGEGSSGDIALVELSSPVTFTNYILPICLPDSAAQFPSGTKCWVTGWGQTQTGVDLGNPQTLQELEVPIIDRDTCNGLFSINPEPDLDPNPIKEDMICAGYAEGRRDACQGDSGGPLVCECDIGWVLAGIVSWGEGCAEANRPGVYTSVPYYANWISEHISNLTLVESRNCGDRNAGRNWGLQKTFILLPILGCLQFALL